MCFMNFYITAFNPIAWLKAIQANHSKYREQKTLNIRNSSLEFKQIKSIADSC